MRVYFDGTTEIRWSLRDWWE